VFANQYSKDENDGFYVIDGTLPTTEQVKFSKKDDLLVEVGLGNTQPTTGNNSSTWNAVKEEAGKIDWGKYTASFKEAWSAPGGIFKNLSCIGGSAFDSGNLAQVIDEITAWYSFLTTNLNKAIEMHLLASKNQPYPQNFNPVGNMYLDLWKLGGAVHVALQHHRNQGWNSACTERNFDIAIDFAKKIHINFTDKIVLEYLSKYFDIEVKGTENINMGQFCTGQLVNVNWLKCNAPVVWQQTNRQFNLKTGITEIPALEFTAPITNAITNNTNISIADIIGGLKTIITVAGIGGNNNSGGNNNQEIIVDPNDPNSNIPENNTGTSKFGFGTTAIILGGLIVAGTIYYQNKNKPLKK
jgi:hypothetical protein